MRAILMGTLVIVGALAAVHAQQVTKETVAGVTNFARLETTVACAGATTSEAMPALKQMGFRSVINLRFPTETNADIPAAEAAAKAVNLNYINIPVSPQAPEPAAADRFIVEISKPENQPAFIHCGGGSRAAMMWMIKRLVIDKWDVDRAAAEATALGLTSATQRQFAIDYAKKRLGA
jgi:uncharacterized protein (TIGR01244 family)